MHSVGEVSIQKYEYVFILGDQSTRATFKYAMPQPRALFLFLLTPNLSLDKHVTSLSAKYFLPARRYASAGLCDSDVSVCLSVYPSVRHTPVLCLAERKQDREMYTI